MTRSPAVCSFIIQKDDWKGRIATDGTIRRSPISIMSEEVATCRRMRLCGAIEFEANDIVAAGPNLEAWKPNLLVAWPQHGGGVWVLHIPEPEHGIRARHDYHLLWALRNLETMDQLCHALEEPGATFYTEPDSCPEILVAREAADADEQLLEELYDGEGKEAKTARTAAHVVKPYPRLTVQVMLYMLDNHVPLYERERRVFARLDLEHHWTSKIAQDAVGIIAVV